MKDVDVAILLCRRLMGVAVAVLFAFGQTAVCGGPVNTMLVVNADSWASTCIANEYVHARGIPPGNVIYLAGLPSFDSMTVEEFRQKILRPVLNTIEARGLVAQTDAILYSADFPTVINMAGDLGGRKLPPTAPTPQASLNSLTYYYPLVMTKSVGYLDLNSNFYARRVMPPTEQPPWTDAERERYVKALEAVVQAGQVAEQRRAAALKSQVVAATGATPEAAGNLADEVKESLASAVETLAALKQAHPTSSELLYNLGCGLALQERPDEAVAALQAAAAVGWFDAWRAEREDENLLSLRPREDFQRLIARVKEMPFDLTPTLGFRGAAVWGADGRLVPDEQGMRYMISTVLACTSGRGNSVREAIANLKRSVSADGTRPAGSVYFLKNGDVRSLTREWGFGGAVAKLKAAGVKGEVLPGVLPQNKTDVAGLTVGSASFDWSASGSRILPGAICEHLTSCGGMLNEGAGQTPLTEFIRYGAAGASGTVDEPYALQEKFPTPFIHYFYAQGCTLGEAFYQALSGPYQLLIVGDALCKPWARRLEVRADGLRAGATLKGTVKVVPAATSPDGVAAGWFQLFVDGKLCRTVKPGESFELDTTTIPDGAHELTVVANGADALATQGMLVVPLDVRNHKPVLTATLPARRRFAWTERVEIHAELPGAREIVFFHNGRPVARLDGAKGVVTIDPRVLGQGPVRLTPVGVIEGLGQVQGAPLAFTVVPPPVLAARQLPSGHTPADDFRLLLPGKPAVMVKRAEGAWLEKALVGQDTAFSVEGWFNVPETDVYQFQIRGNVSIESLTVDDTPQDWPRGPEWWFVPVSLAQGWHFFRLQARGVAQPELEIRFGGEGTALMNGSRFKHLKSNYIPCH